MDDFFITTQTNNYDDVDDHFLDSIRYGGKDLIEDFPMETSEQQQQFVVISEDYLGEDCEEEDEDFGDDEQIIITTQNAKQHYIIVKEEEEDSSSSSSSSSSSRRNENKQELLLSDEEKRLLTKEGITLPTHYPLTKFEERELKRIRRKIRNKISAQDSRKRKKEFLDKLQQRVHEIEEEKTHLSKKVRTLESANMKLQQQVKRLQMALKNQQQTKPNVSTTTLLVLILSLALVVLPSSKVGRDRFYDDVGNKSNNVVVGGEEDYAFAPISRTMQMLPLHQNQFPKQPDLEPPFKRAKNDYNNNALMPTKFLGNINTKYKSFQDERVYD